MKFDSLFFRVTATCALLPVLAGATTFQVTGTSDAPWKKIFGSLGITEGLNGTASIVVLGRNAQTDVASLPAEHIVIIEGAGTAAQRVGIVPKPNTVPVRQICDMHAPDMQIIWEEPETLPAVDLPDGYTVFASEKWKDIPVLAGKRTAHGAILWVATKPGISGTERYPYLLQALVDLGLPIGARSTTLWAFFDSSYRIRADVDYLARRWRRSGVAILHVAAWHNLDSDPVQDRYLRQLIDACHRNAILVYAWLELPHVSEQFWADHPQWREKTAVGQDAQLDWRKLMNLQNPDCRRAVAQQITELLQNWDWDGVNLAELYFESLEGASNPSRFTPMNDDVRRDFEHAGGFDPKLLFDPASSYFATKNPEALRKFLDYRAKLASRMQADWLDVVDKVKATKPYLDVVLTHIDDRFEPGIRDALGADIQTSLPSILARRSTLLVEDPATLWNLGPERYSKLADKYKELTPDAAHLAVDINVVERYQDVYPTKKQTGVELFELVHQAAASFSHVALYFENSVERQDLSLLPVAATTATAVETSVHEIDTNAAEPTRIAWRGPAEIDGQLWPVQNADSVLAPSGRHRLSAATSTSAITITDFNGDIRSALSSGKTVELSYTSQSRAVAILGGPVSSVQVDGSLFWKPSAGETNEVLLPAGQHVAVFTR